MIPSYPKIYALGHRVIADLFKDDVIVEEKIDGSQISFGVIDGKLYIRSKGADIHPDAPEKMFKRAVEVILALQPELIEGTVYRGEYLEKPKHNVLAYGWMPANHIILYDVQRGVEYGHVCNYDGYMWKATEARRLGLEIVPLLFEGRLSMGPAGMEILQELLQRQSILGGQLIEGVVIKNYHRVEQYTGGPLFGKYVSEAFKETHAQSWKQEKGDFVQRLTQDYISPARWAKAVQHLRERGLLTETLADIGKLIAEVKLDVWSECQDEIKDRLAGHFMPQVVRASTGGLPQWYKDQLLRRQFAADGVAEQEGA